MVNFTPIPGANYRYDYEDIFRSIANSAGRVKAVPSYRDLCRKDLFFLLYFGLERIDVNNPFVVDCIREVEECHEDTLDLWAREHYKDVWCETPIITRNGWKKHGELEVGDEVFSIDGTLTRVIARTPNYEKSPCYRVSFTDGSEMVAGKGHLWLVCEYSRRRQNYKRINRWPFIRSTGYLANIDHDALSKGGHRIQVPFAWPLIIDIVDLPIEPYVLGVWLGDGGTESGKICKPDNETWDILERYYPLSPPHQGQNCRSHTLYGLRKDLHKASVLKSKHIPEIYQTASISQRRALLQGLMDTDGHCDDRGTATFVNTNERLAANVWRLATSLSLHPSLRPVIGEYKGQPCLYYQVSFQAYEEDHVFRLSRKQSKTKRGQRWGYRYIAAVEPVSSEPTNCIQVAHPSGMYLAGKELIPTHNSTIITYGLPIQEVIRDTEQRICFFSHTRPIAKGFLRPIKFDLEQNRPVKGWFPDIFWAKPKSQAQKWSEDDGLIVIRKSTAKEATFEAWGLIDGQPVSKHFTIRIYDDVVTREGVTTAEQIKKVGEAYELSHSLGTTGGKKRLAGTHYHFADLYAQLIAKGTYKVRIKPATDDGTATGNPVFLSRERLNELLSEQGSYIFSCQQLLKPVAPEDQVFKPAWVKYYDELPAGLDLYILVDPANEKQKKSDFTVMAVIGISGTGDMYLVDLIRGKLSLRERWLALALLIMKYPGIRAVGYEKYGKDADISYMEEKQMEENRHFAISALGGTMSKVDRIRRLQPKFEAGKFLLPRSLMYEGQDMVKVFLDEEYNFFPFCIHDDCLDAVARIFDILALHAPIGQAFTLTEHNGILESFPVPPYTVLYFTYKYGFTTPFSCGWWWTDADGRLYRFFEWYGANGVTPHVGLGLSDTEVADSIVKREKALGIHDREIIRIGSPDCFPMKGAKGKGRGPTTAEIFRKKGLVMVPGDPTRSVMIRQFRERLRYRGEEEKPMMMIDKVCKDFIRTIPSLSIDPTAPEDIAKMQESYIFEEAALICSVRPLGISDDNVKKIIADKERKAKREAMDSLSRMAQEDYERVVEENSIQTGGPAELLAFFSGNEEIGIQ